MGGRLFREICNFALISLVPGMPPSAVMPQMMVSKSSFSTNNPGMSNSVQVGLPAHAQSVVTPDIAKVVFLFGLI